MKIYTLENHLHKISFLDHGATIYEWIVKSKNRNIVLTNKNLDDYKSINHGFLGATIGRVTNRIKDGKFMIENEHFDLGVNFDNGKSLIHGGDSGYWNRAFEVTHLTDTSITFQINDNAKLSPFPGNVLMKVIYTLKLDTLDVVYEGRADKKTPINITNHSYFNLSNEETIMNHQLSLKSSYFLETDKDSQITGNKIPMNSILELSTNPKLEKVILKEELQKNGFKGLDHCYMLDDKKITLASSDLKLEVRTSYPAVQIYTLGFPPPQLLNTNKNINRYQGVAIECQYESDAVNHKNFSNIIFSPERKYQEFISYKILEREN